MQPNEKLVVLLDFVGGHINQTWKKFKELKEACIKFFKGAADSSSELQVADLLQMFHNIKVPDKHVNKLSQPMWYVYIQYCKQIILNRYYRYKLYELFIIINCYK